MAEHKVHRLKTWPGQFAAIMAGVKPFEYRKNDRDFQPGDTALLEEWMPETAIYTGRVLERRITYVLRAGEFGVPDGYCVFGHTPASPPATAIPDYPDADCTDAAHPAWWRGEEHGTRSTCQKVNDILDGKDSGAGVASDPWEATRRRLLALVAPPATAAESVALREMREILERVDAPFPAVGILPDAWEAQAMYWHKEAGRLRDLIRAALTAAGQAAPPDAVVWDIHEMARKLARYERVVQGMASGEFLIPPADGVPEDMRRGWMAAREAVQKVASNALSAAGQAATPSEPVKEHGPWTARTEIAEKPFEVFVESDDFTHDVRLYVSGDFRDNVQRLAYAWEIARRLNAAGHSSQGAPTNAD